MFGSVWWRRASTAASHRIRELTAKTREAGTLRVLSEEVAITLITVWPRTNYREGTQPHPSVKIRLKIFHGCWSDCEEIPHIQGQRSPTKTVGAGVAAVQQWSNFVEIPHVQGQRGSPSKMVGGAKSHLESNPIPTRDLRGLTHTLCAPGPRDPPETETELCLPVS